MAMSLALRVCRPLPPEIFSGTDFSYRVDQHRGRSATEEIRVVEKIKLPH
jgi:hypothetical protein